jgi:hypothetical protein
MRIRRLAWTCIWCGWLPLNPGFLSAEERPGNHRDVSITDIGQGVRLISRLGTPVGTLTTLRGRLVNGPFKGYEGGPTLRVQMIDGVATQREVRIGVDPYHGSWSAHTLPGRLHRLPMGADCEIRGYVTGEFVGHPAAIFAEGVRPPQTTDLYFRERFLAISATLSAPVRFVPRMFATESGLLSGTAASIGGAGVMCGEGWTVRVQDRPWPADIEGKAIETLGRYRPVTDGIFAVDGPWRLARLEDQIGRPVVLRGRARSLNGFWWFHYRGSDLHVEDMDRLPGWTQENHWRPMEIRGRLERAVLPRLDQITLKPDRDLAEAYIIRDAAWAPMSDLLSPEEADY